MEPDQAAVPERRDEGGAVPVAAAHPGGGAKSSQERPIEQIVRSLAVIAAMFYVVGFLTANSYLYLLGVSDFSLLRTRFILTGVLVLAPLAFALAFGVYAAIDAAVYEERGSGFNRTLLWLASDVLLPFALYFALFSFVAENDILTAAIDAALLSVTCSVIVLALLAALAVHRRTDRRPVSHLFYGGDRAITERFNHRFGIPAALVEQLAFVIAGTLLFLAYVGLFGSRFYPDLPEQIGGGRPRTTQLLIAAGSEATVNRLGLAVTAADPLSPPVQLLWEGEESYVIRLPLPRQRAVVQIDHGLVDGVVTGATLTPVAATDPP
ncbi:MAG: hypothetical protein M3509_11455 [Chloroflexota bacterium]|nr:hypothetical protein [Chloroflexota bacterium]